MLTGTQALRAHKAYSSCLKGHIKMAYSAIFFFLYKANQWLISHLGLSTPSFMLGSFENYQTETPVFVHVFLKYFGVLQTAGC